MVKVQIPFEIDAEHDSDRKSETGDNEDEVGIMSSSDQEESEVDDDIGDPDWDDIENKDKEEQNIIKSIKLSIPQEGIKINLGPAKSRTRRKIGKNGEDSGDDYNHEQLDVPKKKKKRLDLNEYIRKQVNRVKITEQLMKHKLSLLLYLARGLRLVRIINNDIIRALSMSIVSGNRIKIKGKKLTDLHWLEQFVSQIGDMIQISSDEDKIESHTKQPFMINMLNCYANLEVTTLMEFVVIFVACLKAMRPDLSIRIINVLRPITMIADIIPKPPSPTEPPTTLNGATQEQIDTSTPITTSASIDDKDFTMFYSKKKDNPTDVDSNQPKNGNKKQKNGIKKEVKKETEVITIDDDGIVSEKLDFWVEVYLESEKRWCCVDLCNLKLDEPTVLVELSQPFNYLVSYDIDRLCIKAAEKNYCQNWYTPGFKRNRCEDKWWNSLLEAMGPSKFNEKDAADETRTDEILIKQDMPTSDNGFRNHPLFVLKKHLLKFQAIYPPEVAPLGFFKEEPIYPRDCVRLLRSRETWLREARTVKLNETPYKIVTARPKYDRYSGNLIRDLPLELFGEWQTKEYDPPEAIDGKVPRNCYGNVDMYKECMLPKGCKWLKLPGLPRVANQLGIDSAPAVIGFDNHCGRGYGAHPVVDGFIVCEEHADTLQMAWEEAQAISRQKEEDKRQKRIWDNWKRLIKAAQIRERLRVKYKNS